jgi:hypothetical protein
MKLTIVSISSLRIHLVLNGEKKVLQEYQLKQVSSSRTARVGSFQLFINHTLKKIKLKQYDE